MIRKNDVVLIHFWRAIRTQLEARVLPRADPRTEHSVALEAVIIGTEASQKGKFSSTGNQKKIIG